MEAVEADSEVKIYLPYLPFGLLMLLIRVKGQVDFQSLFSWKTHFAQVNHVLLASMRSMEAVEADSEVKIYLPYLPYGLLMLLIRVKGQEGQVDFYP